MDKLTPEALITFLWVAAAIVAFVIALWNLADKIKAARRPNEELRLWQAETDAKLDRDKKRLDTLEEGQRTLCRGILALLSHEINGNSIDKLKDAQIDLTNYLIER